MNGVIALWKPKGMTSHDCVVQVRQLLKTKKVGHTGTLDPDVEGVLPICVGKATKVVELITSQPKTYTAEISLGKQTTTEDASGDIIKSQKVASDLSFSECISHAASFVGELKQIPPMYSAVKVDGMKLYEYAREGIEVERPERLVTIHDLHVTSDQLEFLDEEDVRFQLQVTCSSGTYIRTLCVDLGRKIGYPAHMSSLVRNKAGSFESEDTLSLQDLENLVNNDQIDSILKSPSIALPHIAKYVVEKEDYILIQQGRVIDCPQELKEEPIFRMESEDQELLAIYQQHPSKPGLIKPLKVLV
ncbi:tRNA pseudouridine(55) synthase TruB [Halalkalibacillus halophilus]|uniref:tRNA pseudouridine(55) synthase TruB n=1 Tax=Halalkalibacillus halophilus TaxID=392827 RepID=UPI0003FC37A1|nr:tRNA pseudouridine(55) synthase TruB [Halalkalibacillus halophilus]